MRVLRPVYLLSRVCCCVMLESNGRALNSTCTRPLPKRKSPCLPEQKSLRVCTREEKGAKKIGDIKGWNQQQRTVKAVPHIPQVRPLEIYQQPKANKPSYTRAHDLVKFALIRIMPSGRSKAFACHPQKANAAA